jgi:hypothetical protein
MKVLLAGAMALMVSIPAVAAQQPAASTAPAAATAAATAAGNVPIETLMASPVSKAAVLKQFPDLEKHPAYETFKSVSLRDLAPMSGGAVTEEKIATVEAELKTTK